MHSYWLLRGGGGGGIQHSNNSGYLRIVYFSGILCMQFTSRVEKHCGNTCALNY